MAFKKALNFLTKSSAFFHVLQNKNKLKQQDALAKLKVILASAVLNNERAVIARYGKTIRRKLTRQRQ